MKIFISHTKRDAFSRTIAKKLAIFLEERSLDVLFDEFSFQKGQSIIAQISELVYSADRFIFVCSPKALGSNWVSKELNLARDKSVQMHPRPFIYVLNVGGESGFNLLPNDLKGDLIISANKRNYKDKFYELFFALHAFEMNNFVRSDRRSASEAAWAIFERIDVLDINEQLDAVFDTKYVLNNYSNIDLRYTHKSNYWAENAEQLKNISIKAFDDRNNELDVKKNVETFRGKITHRYEIKTKYKIKSGRNFYFTIKTIFRKAYAGDHIGDYLFDFEQKQYGRYKCFITLPRSFPATKIWVEKDSGKDFKKTKLGKKIGRNRFSLELLFPSIGNRYRMRFRLPKKQGKSPRLRPNQSLPDGKFAVSQENTQQNTLKRMVPPALADGNSS